MEIEGSVALVTGANRGIGRAFTRALLGYGAARVYAGARDPAGVADTDVTPLRLDVTKPGQGWSALGLNASWCADRRARRLLARPAAVSRHPALP